MIDPKLNELPVDAEGDFDNRPESTLSEEEKQLRAKQAAAGYSVKDSIAGDVLLSDGSRGVDVSGVKTGAGAGAGSTIVTPAGPDEPANTEIERGSRGSGFNYRNDPDFRENK